MIPLSVVLAYTLTIAICSGVCCYYVGRRNGYRRGFKRAAYRAHQEAIPTLMRVKRAAYMEGRAFTVKEQASRN